LTGLNCTWALKPSKTGGKMRINQFLLIFIWLIYSNPVPARDWPMFRGDARHQALAIDVSDTLFQYATWTFSCGGSIFASPVAAQGKVFVAATDNFIYCLADNSGELLWKTELGSWAEATPVISGDKIFVGAMDHQLYALSVPTGAILWQTDLGSWIESSPVVVGQSLFVGGTNHRLFGLDTETGQVRWQFPVGGDIYSSPAYHAGLIYFGCDDHHFYAVDTLGQLHWQFDTAGYSIYSSPTVTDSLVIFGTIDNGVIAPPDSALGYSWNNQIFALNAQTGAEVWKLRVENFGLMHSSPAADSATVYYSTDQGRLRAIDLATGQIRWETQMPDSSLVWAAPAIAAGVVYLPSVAGRLGLFSTQTGAELGQFTLSGDSLFVHASPAITQNFLYFAASDGKLYALSKMMPAKVGNWAAKSPDGFRLFPNFPNPFNPQTCIRYHLLAPEWVTLTIYNLLGQQVKSLVNEFQPVGTHQVFWDGRDASGREVASGEYIFRLEAGTHRSLLRTQRMLLLR
jgi:outer membrane protein assembly factor BamB